MKCLKKEKSSRKCYRDGDLVDVCEDERVVIDVGLGDARRLGCWRIARVRKEFFRLVVVVDVEALGAHKLGALLVD